MRDPLPHQPPMLRYMESHRAAAGLMVDKRLGKTYCGSYWARYHDAKKTLVVAPISAIPGWLDETEKDREDLAWDLTNPHNLKEWVKFNGDLPGRFFITNPQGIFTAGRGADPSPREVLGFPWDAVIWDETVTLKNPQSQINKIAKDYLSYVPMRCGLSGEYAPEGPLDVFEQMVWIFGSFMGHQNFWEWRNEFFDQLLYEFFPKKGKLNEIKHTVTERAFVLSRKDAGIKDHAFYEPRYCTLPATIRAAYDQAERLFAVPASVQGASDGAGSLDPRPIRFTSYSPVVRNWLCQLTGGRPKAFPDLHSDHKMNLLWETIREYGNKQLVVSFRHNAEMDAAHTMLSQKGVKAEKVWGDLDASQRRQMSHDFDAKKFQVQLKQAKVHFGMDLSAADIMIRYSLPEAFNDISQDRDRIVSPLKQRPLTYIDLVTRDSVDEDLMAAANIEKHSTARFFMDKLNISFWKRTGRKETPYVEKHP